MIRQDDDHIETTILTRSLNVSMSDTEDAFASRAHSPLPEEDDDEGHGKTTDGAVACCRQYSDGQVNCGPCLNSALKAWAVESNTNEQEVSRRVLDVLDEAGPAGLHISTLIVRTHLTISVMTILVIIRSGEGYGRKLYRNCSIYVILADEQHYTSRRSRGPFSSTGRVCTTFRCLDGYCQ